MSSARKHAVKAEPALPASIAIIIPVYQHSLLLFDAVASLQISAGSKIIIIDDGCPNIETQYAGLGLAALHPHVIYLRGANRGLSGARNRGIDYVMGQLPDIAALYFLDADNMLSPWSFPAMQAALTAHPAHDWFYPDIRMFGLSWDASYRGNYLPLIETLLNVCEAGSLVRRRVFAAGLRFSEELNLGFEDWDFWLSATEHGFAGLHLESSGFRYRKRPESMLANATRDQHLIHSQLEQRHPWMLDLKWAVAAEHAAVPRYAIYLTDLGVVRLTSGPALVTETLGWADYIARFWAALRAPKSCHAGALLLVTTSAALASLETMKLLEYCFFDTEMRLRESNIATIGVLRGPDSKLAIAPAAIGTPQHAGFAAIPVATLRDIAQRGDERWIATAASAAPEPRISQREVSLPRQAPYGEPIGDMLAQLVRACTELRLSAFAPATALPAQDTGSGTPDRAAINHMLRAKFGGGVLPPMLQRKGPEIAFALPVFAFGGVEKVTMFVARALRRRGYVVSLLLCKNREIMLAPEFADAFDRVFFLDNPEFETWTGPNFMGTALSRWSVAGEHANELNLLSIFDAVIGCHAGDVMGLMGGLQRRGVVTGAYNHLFDVTETGRQCGHPHIALAFEFALDLFICCSENIGLALHGNGVPAGKIVTVPNAPGADIPDEIAARCVAARKARAGKKLNILFLGRIDQQKGLDRLGDLCTALAGQERANIRIIGRQLLSAGAAPAGIAALLEPPVQGEELLAAYEWADILLLPSHYEGAPLTLIEAMRMGVVPIAAAAGAVGEIITDGVNGFIVSQSDCVAEILARVDALNMNRDRLQDMMHAAASVRRNWDDSVDILDLALRRMLERRELARAPAPE